MKKQKTIAIIMVAGSLTACAPNPEQQALLDMSHSDIVLMSCNELSSKLGAVKQGLRDLGADYTEAALSQNDFQASAYEYANLGSSATTQTDFDIAQAGAAISMVGVVGSQLAKSQSEGYAGQLKTQASRIIQTQRDKGC